MTAPLLVEKLQGQQAQEGGGRRDHVGAGVAGLTHELVELDPCAERQKEDQTCAPRAAVVSRTRTRRCTHRLAEEKHWWRWQRTHGLCLAVRQAAAQADPEEIAERLETPTGLQRLRRLLKRALPNEAAA